MIKKGKVIVLSGPSGSGKTTLVKYIIKNITNIKFSISCTTRNKRYNETNGTDYYFISKKKFLEKIKENEFIEYEEVYKDIWYGTLKSEVYNSINKGTSIIFDIDVTGALNIKNIFKNECLTIYIKTESIEITKNRLLNRNSENDKSIKERISRYELENSKSKLFDYNILNDDIIKTNKQILNIINNFLKTN